MDYKEIEILASKVKDSGSFIFVPAFNGLYAPHWRPDARGTMTGITQVRFSRTKPSLLQNNLKLIFISVYQ